MVIRDTMPSAIRIPRVGSVSCDLVSGSCDVSLAPSKNFDLCRARSDKDGLGSSGEQLTQHRNQGARL
eukprot:2811-Amphidinium_carterae.1